MAQRCSHCGRTKAQHKGPDGKYLACVDVEGFKRVLKEQAKAAGPESTRKG